MQSQEPGSKNLVQLAQLSASVENALLESGGELTPEIEAMLEVVGSELPAKVDSYRHILDRLEKSEEFYKDRAKQYQTAAKACANAIDRLKGNIKYAMNALGASKVEGNEFKFTMSKMPSKVVVFGVVPKQYLKEIISHQPDLDAIRSDLAMGEALDFARIDEVYALRGGLKGK